MSIIMTAKNPNRAKEENRILVSQMKDLALIPAWIEKLGCEHGIPAEVQFAMDLCLEEIVSNIIRHGYSNEPGRPIVVRYRPGKDRFFVLIVEDEAPPFNPLDAEEIPVEETLEGDRLGGHGLRLVRRFATSIEYEPTAGGNRLRIGFQETGKL